MKKFIVIAVCVAALISGGIYQRVSNKQEIVGTVTDKVVKNSKDESKYLIFTKDEDGNSQVFENVDSLLLTKFNSSDVYAQIEIGETYKFETRGYRVPLLSLYPNIVECEDVE